MKAPSRSVLCEWIKLAWDSISTDLITNSFLSCAITTAVDGSNDDDIHCFKATQPCAAGRQLLKDEMEKLIAGEAEGNLTDPFASDVDDDEMEENEVCIDNDSVAGENSESDNDTDSD